jgi:hypothetical protein
LGLIFNREFNRFIELWRGIDLTENKKNPIEEAETKEREEGTSPVEKINRRKKGGENEN